MQLPWRVPRLIFFNSWRWSSRADPDYKTLRLFLNSPLMPFSYRYRNASPRFLLPLPYSLGDKKLDGRLLKQYTAPFANPAQRNGPVAFARSLVNDQDWFEELWQQRQSIAQKPTLFIWGMNDPILKPHYLTKFASGFPGATIRQVAGSGHFPQEKAAQPVARFMADWLA